MADHIICSNTNCNYRGEATAVARGSRVALVLLFMFGFFPGVIYMLFFTGWDNYCPRCNLYLGRGRSGPSMMGSSALLGFIVLMAMALAFALYSSNRTAEEEARRRREADQRLEQQAALESALESERREAAANADTPAPGKQDAGTDQHRRRRHSRGQ